MPHSLFRLALTAALAMLATIAQAQVGISPPIVELRLDQPAQVHTLRLHNFENRDKQVAVSVVNWTLDPAGEVQVLPTTETSLNRAVIVSPLNFTLKARSVQTVRVAVRPPMALAAGEHRAMIYFDEILPETSEAQGVRGRFRIGAAVYAYQGEPQRSGRLSGLKVSEGRLQGSFDSTGNSHVRLGGHYGIWRAAEFPGLANSPLAARADAGQPKDRPAGLVAAENLPSAPALPGGRRDFVVELPALEPGNYVLEFRGSLSAQAHAEAIKFTVPRPSPGR